MLLISIILAVVIAALVVTAKRLMLGDEEFSESDISDKYVIPGVAIGLVVGLVNYLSVNLTERPVFLAPIFMIIMIGLLVWLVRWWIIEGGSWIEMIPCIILAILFCLTMKAPAYVCSLVIGIPLFASLISMLPWILLIIAIFMMIFNYLKFCYVEMDDTDAQRRTHKGLGWLTAMVAALALIGLLATQVDWALNPAYASDEGNSDVTIEQNEDTTYEWIFFNLLLQDDQDDDNDFNFGYNPGDLTAVQYDANFRERLRNDPALGAADMAWADAKLGTRYLGEFYESCKGDWAKTINAAKEVFIEDPVFYSKTLDAFFKMLDKAEVKVTKGTDLDDQMYMNPYTVDGIPDVIVMETPDHTGTFLTYVFTIKGKKVEVSYRTECGYQPTNVEEVMGITPQKTPTKPDKPDKPTKPDKPDNPSKPKYDKDPEKAPKKNTEPNDDKGPGPDTNNPSDPQHSTKDTKDSSTSGSYQDYKDNVDKLKDTNKNQKTGNDSNKPSTPAPKKDTNVDNNGDKGTGNGGANTPTPTKDKAKEADTGKEIKDSPGEAWGGPSD